MTNLVITEKPEPGEVRLTPAQVAERIGLTNVDSLAAQRSRGVGPRYRRLPNGRILYPEWAVADWEVGGK